MAFCESNDSMCLIFFASSRNFSRLRPDEANNRFVALFVRVARPRARVCWFWSLSPKFHTTHEPNVWNFSPSPADIPNTLHP